VHANDVRAPTVAEMVPVGYSFDAFRDDVKLRVRLLNARLRTPEAVWPGVLLLDLPLEGLSAEAFEIGISPGERRYLAERVLPRAIRTSGARRFCWVMPAFAAAGDIRRECLLLVIGECGRVEAALADVVRSGDRPPRLGPFNDGPFGAGARRVSGLFVEPLVSALET
jgi:hypothetical protein